MTRTQIIEAAVAEFQARTQTRDGRRSLDIPAELRPGRDDMGPWKRNFIDARLTQNDESALNSDEVAQYVGLRTVVH